MAPLTIKIDSLLCFDEIFKRIFIGIKGRIELGPDDLGHLLLPSFSLLHGVLDGAVNALVAFHGVLYTISSALSTFDLEGWKIGLDLILGLDDLLKVRLEAFNACFYGCWHFGELLKIVSESHGSFGLLHVVESLELVASAVFGEFGLCGQTLSLLEDFGHLLSDAGLKGIDVVHEGLVDLLTGMANRRGVDLHVRG
jgi:hypothetical protein